MCLLHGVERNVRVARSVVVGEQKRVAEQGRLQVFLDEPVGEGRQQVRLADLDGAEVEPGTGGGYVSLAEALGCPLLTLDRKLSRARGAIC